MEIPGQVLFDYIQRGGWLIVRPGIDQACGLPEPVGLKARPSRGHRIDGGVVDYLDRDALLACLQDERDVRCSSQGIP